MSSESLQSAIPAVPSGAWAVGVSGGADSVALLSLLRERTDLSLHTVHLDHQTRGQASTDDARFVQELAAKWHLACTVAVRDQIESGMAALPANPSARYRAVRMELFGRTVQSHQLAGVILAHHADDQAETILQRLLRGSGPAGLGGMAARSAIGEVLVLRPLLSIPRQALRDHLRQLGQTWRDDASNTSPKYLRNRLRTVLAAQVDLTEDLLSLAAACRELSQWTAHAAPFLAETFRLEHMQSLPAFLAEESAKRWLRARGVPPEELGPEVIQRLRLMASDAASPPRQHFPGRVLVRRRGGVIWAEERSTGRQAASGTEQPVC